MYRSEKGEGITGQIWLSRKTAFEAVIGFQRVDALYL